METQVTEAGLARVLEAERDARVRAEAVMRREAAVAEASTLLVGSETDPFPAIVRILGEVHQVDRSYLFLLRDNGARMDNTAEWCAPGIEPQIGHLQDLDTAVFPWWIETLSRGDLIEVEDVSALPPEAAAEREILEMQGVRSVAAVPLIDPRGRLIGFMGFDRVTRTGPWLPEDLRAIQVVSQMSAREISRRRMLDALHRSQERYRLAGLATRDLLYDWDMDRGVLTLGEGGSSALGVTGNRLVTIDWWYDRIHPDDRERIRVGLEAAIEGTAEGWEATYRFLVGDGERWAHIVERGYFVRNADGRAVRMVGVMSDRTEEVRMERDLRHAQKMQAVGALAGGVAHEFNNLLAVVLGYADLLAGDPGMDPELRGAALEIRDAAERGNLLTGQLLAFGRKQVVFPEPLRLADAMGRIVRLLRRVLPESIEILPPVVAGDPWIRADRNQVDQVLLNLAVNARDAMPGGGRLELHARRAGSVVHLEVTDTGEGIPEEVRPRIFEPFFTTKPVGQGTGLGLSTVYGIVRDLGGTIDFRSRVGAGTTFVLVFPVHESGAGGGAGAHGGTYEVPATAAPHASPEPSGSRPPLLVVEDDPGVARLCRRILTRRGHTVHLARSSDEALSLVGALSPEDRGALGAILCDVGLPGLPGPRLAEELERRHPELRGLPRLFISGYTASATALAEEGARVLPKPFTAEALLALVGDATARR